MFLTPSSIKNLAIAIPAAPAPLIVTLTSANNLSTYLRELIKAAPTTIAVPC